MTRFTEKCKNIRKRTSHAFQYLWTITCLWRTFRRNILEYAHIYVEKLFLIGKFSRQLVFYERELKQATPVNNEVSSFNVVVQTTSYKVIQNALLCILLCTGKTINSTSIIQFIKQSSIFLMELILKIKEK